MRWVPHVSRGVNFPRLLSRNTYNYTRLKWLDFYNIFLFRSSTLENFKILVFIKIREFLYLVSAIKNF